MDPVVEAILRAWSSITLGSRADLSRYLVICCGALTEQPEKYDSYSLCKFPVPQGIAQNIAVLRGVLPGQTILYYEEAEGSADSNDVIIEPARLLLYKLPFIKEIIDLDGYLLLTFH